MPKRVSGYPCAEKTGVFGVGGGFSDSSNAATSATVWCQSGQLVVESSTPGMSAFHSGSLTSSNRVHSCLWREFAASNGRWSGLLHEIYDIGERDVVDLRHLAVAPAQVQAHHVGRNVVDRMIQSLDMQPDLVARW